MVTMDVGKLPWAGVCSSELAAPSRGLAVTCSKGPGRPPMDQFSACNASAPPRLLGSCKSLPPDAFRFEAPPRVGTTKPRALNKEVLGSHIAEAEPARSPASTPLSSTSSSRAARFSLRGKNAGARMTCHDLRAWVASGATTAAPANLSRFAR
eukprot:TRINITY_DN23866_c0_g1_i2.p1 TRINITY_DN23866_c0_g1~~TRINITY_DN23866_c0_g1_i2.p1  ORF type:complete len:153 (+),score=12.55 TRINITY_DN23866_c0_g1_i2:131-589(+)